MKDVIAQPGISKVSLREKAESIRNRLNPHPAGQKEENVPLLDGGHVPGMQHKYRETILFFPTEVSAKPSTSVSGFLRTNRANFATPSARTASVGPNSPPWGRISSFNQKMSLTSKPTSVGISR